MKKQLYLILIMCCCVCGWAQAQNSESTAMATPDQAMVDKLLEQIQSYPQEKIYLQTDKPYYSAGDTIWFKAYMLHASIHQPMAFSRYIYVELINAQNQVIIREKIRPEENHYYCQIPLHSKIVPGQYSLRAYTNYMRNIDESYFFRKEIYIGNVIQSGDDTQEEILNMPYYDGSSDYSDNEGDSESQATYAVQFFPEGGHLIAGNAQNIAFKAIDQEGWGCSVSGRVIDEEDKEILQFQDGHKGMGCFALIAEKGKTYTAICENEWGEELRIQLPAATDSTYSLQVVQRPQQVFVKVLAPNNEMLKEDLYMIAHLRGAPYFSYKFSGEQNYTVLPKASIPSGVMQIVLMNAQGECLAERLVFIRQEESAQIELSADKDSYGKRERAHIHLQCKDSKGQLLPSADLSVSVTVNDCVQLDSCDMTIESYLLLTSDLRGHIEQPGAYFLKSNKQADAQLDLLMLTQGWRRYDIPKLCRGELDIQNQHELEVGSILCGRLQTYPIRRAIPQAHISIFNAEHNYVNAVTTDNRGRFCFDGFEYADSTSFFVQAEKKQQGIIMELTMENQDFPPVTCSLPYSRKDMMNDETMLRLLHYSRDRYYFENGTMTINLDEIGITVKASDNIRKERGAMYTYASYTFEPEDIEDFVGATLIDILLQAPGITANSTGDGVLMRNATPLIVINNMPAQMQDLTTIQPMDVEMIDILRDPSQTAMYQGGGNGVICIYLKQGKRTDEEQVLGSHQKVVPYLGYTSPKEFYQPIYSVEKNRNSQLPDYRTTLLWEPTLSCDENGQADFRFYMGDSKSDCSILIEGIGPQGEILRKLMVVKGE